MDSISSIIWSLSFDFKNSIFWNSEDINHVTINGSDIHINYSLIKNGISSIEYGGSAYYGDGIQSNDPLFENTDSYYHALLPESPAIDAGDPSSEYDPDTTVADLGAFYFDQRDLEPPFLVIDQFTNHIGTNDTLQIVWQASDNISLDQLFLSYSSDSLITFELVDSIPADISMYNFDIPDSVKIIVEKQTIVKITGMNKQKVGMTASQIKSFRPPEPYKGKGIREKGQYVLKKEGKKK